MKWIVVVTEMPIGESSIIYSSLPRTEISHGIAVWGCGNREYRRDLFPCQHTFNAEIYRLISDFPSHSHLVLLYTQGQRQIIRQ